ncbi:DUF6114 domain-containing protein [Kitasatospora cheerisanensis]|uniref:Integral membrane protein n=1 Tax=Kitasatospora cheerisanensis KCTC 2395 TaxID=1348663 RepID=A0A066YUE5_9ACTN|nr:DUF6114 domain-containing protein [Kitasatospora cheerisanensis]KDN83609.1 hypothetical protein KCH_50910 [Kitasatospora cheerisanensis KCTC 2395]
MSSATVEAWPEGPAGLASRGRRGFRAWRRTRPFWGGLLAMIAGLPILYFPYAHLSLGGLTVAMSTTAGAGSMIIGILLIVLGLTAWFQPLVRIFCGVATTILALISIPVSNLGGFGMGLVPGLIAGGLLVSWAPLQPLPAAGPETAGAAAPVDAAPTAPLPAQAAAAQPLEYGAAPVAEPEGERP